MTTSLQGLLAGWITGQRWFAGKGRAIDDLSIDSKIEIAGGDPALLHLIVCVRQGDRSTRYQIPVGLREHLPDRLGHVRIGACRTGDREVEVYDALHDSALTRHLLQGMAGDHRFGALGLHRAHGVEIDTAQRSLVLTAEQSNTSLVYGDKYIFKLFRQLTPGINPELEIITALAEAGSTHVAKPYGWIETELRGEPTTLAIMQEYLQHANEGWSMALTSVRDFYASPEGMPAEDAGGDFAAEARRLGLATAQVHRELARAFPTGTIEPPEIKRMTERFRHRLEKAVAEVPALGAHAGVAAEAFDRLADLDHEIPVQRVHGDYHLGQVMRTTRDWVVLDFEGEPGQPLAERRALDSPLRDVAGMLRSFDYAARHLLAGRPNAGGLEGRAREWSERNRAAFLAGYSEGGGGIRGDDAVLLRALELSKAVYEVVYEARNRPSWLPIPIAAFR
ncbi:aminoglycoside phosphotransferase [Microbispora rosea subsp. aerata]|nr:phosphotransferase [Microbispora rosea]GGO05048.1 aminoglycoside phosphotransferase [Microbispora rosea subsp. aerata]GIH56210.1 aminoglycoside phosphotransferase [Microbispora rosea subsp. aerata]GLJ82350.1 aminoglycoside phosphotransferase [Microbispora rosea subsp. aerata]